MSERKKKRRRRHTLQKVLLVVIILVVIILIAFFFVIQPLKQKLVSTVTGKVVESQISSITGYDIDADEIMDIMSEEDQETIEEICNNHMDAQTISELSAYAAKGDTASIKSYVQEALSEEELAEIYAIYEKYQDEIYEYLE